MNKALESAPYHSSNRMGNRPGLPTLMISFVIANPLSALLSLSGSRICTCRSIVLVQFNVRYRALAVKIAAGPGSLFAGWLIALIFCQYKEDNSQNDAFVIFLSNPPGRTRLV